MEAKNDLMKRAKARPEQLKYADLLFYGCWLAIAILFITFFIYSFGVRDPLIPIEKLSHYWSMSVHDYIQESGAPTGWGWAAKLGYGDYLNFVGIALLAGLTVVAYLTLIPAYLKQKDKAFVVIAILECLVLIVAASGILGAGGH
jgi:hypothetical protein